jgi:spore maturation protein CgeB
VERLFLPGRDFLVARGGADLERLLCDVLCDTELANAVAAHGRETILARHTCAHRVHELLAIHDSIRDGMSLAEVKVRITV